MVKDLRHTWSIFHTVVYMWHTSYLASLLRHWAFYKQEMSAHLWVHQLSYDLVLFFDIWHICYSLNDKSALLASVIRPRLQRSALERVTWAVYPSEKHQRWQTNELYNLQSHVDWRIYDIPFELDRQISTVLFGQIPALLEWPTALVASLAPNLLPRHQTNHSPSISIQCPRSVNLLMIFLSFSLLLITNSFL